MKPKAHKNFHRRRGTLIYYCFYFDFLNYFELRSKIVFFNFPEHSFRGDILRISPWTFNYFKEDFIKLCIFVYIFVLYFKPWSLPLQVVVDIRGRQIFEVEGAYKFSPPYAHNLLPRPPGSGGRGPRSLLLISPANSSAAAAIGD